ncbi:hypothetical protein HNP38_001575 [Chryseobacterium defluvii]|uniref:Uncharacterized protein n=1 Tax=Chryseobacterium defluvii TaxID=160396 RepID=A0A840KFJ9_9FLAO|nr:hypothetical protein [Chryseobacterium defluvii]MBB4806303.1 hypothetical protein [Chryseobacterium defluvii]
MLRKLFPVLLLTGSFSFAQVGVNTDSPQATFDVVGSPDDDSKPDGIIAPRISGNLLKEKNYTNSQTGALVYVTSADSAPEGQMEDVTSPGYYYFNGDVSVNKWVKLISTSTSATQSVTVPYDTPNSGSLTLNNTHHTVRIYGGNTEIVLPDAGTCKGRIYILIGSNGISSKPISTLGGNGIYDDVTNAGVTSITGGQRYQIQSDGIGWIVIGR